MKLVLYGEKLIYRSINTGEMSHNQCRFQEKLVSSTANSLNTIGMKKSYTWRGVEKSKTVFYLRFDCSGA